MNDWNDTAPLPPEQDPNTLLKPSPHTPPEQGPHTPPEQGPHTTPEPKPHSPSGPGALPLPGPTVSPEHPHRDATTASRGSAVHWFALLASGMAEAVWAGALAAGVLSPVPAVLFAVGLAASLAGLAYAMRVVPMGTAYAVWTGVGAVTTALYSAWLGEPFGLGKIACLALIIAGVIGLQLSTHSTPRSQQPAHG